MREKQGRFCVQPGRCWKRGLSLNGRLRIKACTAGRSSCGGAEATLLLLVVVVALVVVVVVLLLLLLLLLVLLLVVVVVVLLLQTWLNAESYSQLL